MVYLTWYRNTPHCTTGHLPAELQLGCESKTCFDMSTAVRDRVERAQHRHHQYFRGNRAIVFYENDNVAMRDYSSHSEKWSEAEVVRRVGPVTYLLRTPANKIVKRLVDQMRPTSTLIRMCLALHRVINCDNFPLM